MWQQEGRMGKTTTQVQSFRRAPFLTALVQAAHFRKHDTADPGVGAGYCDGWPPNPPATRQDTRHNIGGGGHGF